MGKDTYNISKPGSGPHEYLQMYKKFGRSLKPDMVIMNIYGGNDLASVIAFRDWWGATAYLNMRKLAESPGKILPPSLGLFLNNHTFMKHSYCLSFIWRSSGDLIEYTGIKYLYYNIVAQINDKYDIPPKQRNKDNYKYSVKVGDRRVPINIFNQDQDEPKFAKRVRDNYLELEAYRDAIDRFAELSKTDQFIPVVTFLPSAYMAYLPSVQFEDDHIFKLLVEFNKLQVRFIEKIARENSIKFIDATLGLRNSAEREAALLYFPANGHLTSFGHTSMANTIASALAD